MVLDDMIWRFKIRLQGPGWLPTKEGRESSVYQVQSIDRWPEIILMTRFSRYSDDLMLPRSKRALEVCGVSPALPCRYDDLNASEGVRTCDASLAYSSWSWAAH